MSLGLPPVSLPSCMLRGAACLLKWLLLQEVLSVACCWNSTCIPFNFCLITWSGWRVGKSACLPFVWGVCSHLCVWMHFMGSPVVPTNYSMMHELNTPQTEFPSAALGCWQACGRTVCAEQRWKQGRGLDGQAALGSTGSALHSAAPCRGTLSSICF